MNEGCSVNSERLWERLSALGRIGRTADGGITRLSFTKEERQAKDLVASYMEEAGLSVREDAAGNLIGRRDGLRKDAPVVMTGSHLDTVPGGGAFDGALGVLGAVEALKSMRERSAKTLHPIEIVCFTDEEGARFGAGMLGSRAMAGILDAAHLRHTDQHGVTVMQAMAEAGLPAERLHEAARAPSDVKAYIELHIEQGKVLERKDVPVGVVSGIAGPLWMKFKVSGEAGHAGATPMADRRDPLPAAAEIIAFMEREALVRADTVATVGRISASPGEINVIAESVEFTLDLRDIDEAARDSVEESIRRRAQDICDKRQTILRVQTLQKVAPVRCAPFILREIAAACEDLGMASTLVMSGAGHDALQFRDFCPVGMIFVRSRNGISHTAGEWSSPQDCAAGAEVLYRSLVRLAGEAGTS